MTRLDSSSIYLVFDLAQVLVDLTTGGAVRSPAADACIAIVGNGARVFGGADGEKGDKSRE